MSAVLASLIAVAGTLLGSLSTYLFQRRTAQHTATAARAERIRQEQEASDRQELKEREREFEAAVLTFVAAAGNLLRHDRM